MVKSAYCRLYSENVNVIKLLEESEAKEKRKNDEHFEEGECEALVLITALVTSFVRYSTTYLSNSLEINTLVKYHTRDDVKIP